MAGLITTAIKKDFVPILRNKLRFDPLAMKGQLQVNAGVKTLRWNRGPDIGAFTTALAETTTTQGQINTITITSVLMTVSDYGAFVQYSDLADSVWTRETREMHADVFGYAGAKTRDTLHYNAALATTNYVVSRQTAANTGTIVGSTTTAIAQDLNTIRGFFDQGDCEPYDSLNANYALIIHGKVEQDMVGDVTTGRLSWSPLIWNVPGPDGTARITSYKGPGALLGIAVMRSNIISTVTLTPSTTPAGSGTVTAYRCIALAEYGLGKTTLDQAEPRIIMKRPGTQTVSVPLDTYGTIGFKLRQAQANLDVARALVYYVN